MVFSDAAMRAAPLGGGDSAKMWSQGGHMWVEVEGAQLSDAPRFDVLARPSCKIRRVSRASFAADTLEARGAPDHAFVARRLYEARVGTPML